MSVECKQVSYNEALESIMQGFKTSYQNNCRCCDICGKELPPQIHMIDGEVYFELDGNDSYKYDDGKVVSVCVCDECLNQFKNN